MTIREAIDSGRDEFAYLDSGRRIGGKVVHLAAREDNFERALCGKRRDNPLEPNAQGDLCVVCGEIYRDKYGREWS